ncbi:MAG: peptide chain release factor-like protein [Elusimicrobiales bacterium]|nr:peptide chain release factor-like protein [Elusimicrobiales bacterium]
MKFGDFGAVTPAKTEELAARIAGLGLDLNLVEEKSVKGGGKGGQKINKTASAVQLKYPPLGLFVRCQRERSRAVNRFLALRELTDKAEMILSPSTSARLAEYERLRRKKTRRSARGSGPSER